MFVGLAAAQSNLSQRPSDEQQSEGTGSGDEQDYRGSGNYRKESMQPSESTSRRPTMTSDDPRRKSGFSSVVIDPEDDGGDTAFHVDFAFQTSELTPKELINGVFEGFEDNKQFCSEHPNWVLASTLVMNIVMFFIAISIIVFMVETLPAFHDKQSNVLFGIETVCIIVFTVEFLTRLFSTPNLKQFWKTPTTWIDFVAIMPYYVDLVVSASTDSQSSTSVLVIFRVLRLSRVVRVLKLSKNNVGIQAVAESLVKSTDAMSLMFFSVATVLIVSSSAMFFAESSDATWNERTNQYIQSDGRVSPFQSVFHALWWSIVTMTTVGYGDEVPFTPGGKAVGGITALLGVFVISFPTVILGANFSTILQQKLAERDRKKLGRMSYDQVQLRKRQSMAVMMPHAVASPRGPLPNPITSPGLQPFVAPDAAIPGESPESQSLEMQAVAQALHSNPYRHLKGLTYRMLDGCAPREIWIDERNPDSNLVEVTYAPSLDLTTTVAGGDNVLVRSDEMYPSGTIISFTVILSSWAVEEKIKSVLTENHVDETECNITPKPVERIKVAWLSPPDVHGVELMCADFRMPRGTIVVPLFVPDAATEKLVVQKFSDAILTFEVFYEKPPKVDTALGIYKSCRLRKGTSGAQLTKPIPKEEIMMPM